jgi:putative spermidine/putrescine transport system substrate-binding protein
MKRMPRHAVYAAAAAALALALAGCSGPAGASKDYLKMSWQDIVKEAKKEKEVVFDCWWGEEYWKEAAAGFEKKYGIKAKVVMGENGIDKILAEKDSAKGSIDVYVMGGASVKTSMEAGVWYGPILSAIPDGDKLDPRLGKIQEGVETKGYLVPLYRNQTGLLYDPAKVSKPPQTWKELEEFIDANPKRFGFCDPNKGGSGQALVQAVIANVCGGLDKYAGDAALVPEKVANWNQAWKWINDRKAKVTITVSNNDSLSRLNQGELSLIVAWDDDTQIALKKGELFKSARMYIPSFGLPGGGDTMGLVKNATHKAAGLLLVSYLVEKESQLKMNEMIGSYLARTDVQTPSVILAEGDRQANGVAWVPAPYKALFSSDFTKNVLMAK